MIDDMDVTWRERYLPRRVRMSAPRVAAVLIAALMLAMSGAGSAHALDGDPDYWKETQTRRDSVHRFLYEQSPQQIPSAYDDVQEDARVLRERQRSLPPSNPTASSLWQRIRTLEIKSALNTPLRALGTVGLALGTYEFGLKMGSDINAKFLRVGLPEAVTFAEISAQRLQFRSQGYVIRESYSGTNPWNGLFSSDPALTMPYDGWHWEHQRGWEAWWGYFNDLDLSWCDTFSAPPPVPDGFERTAAPMECTTDPYAPPKAVGESVTYTASEDALRATAPIEDYNGQPYDRAVAAPPAPSQSSVEDTIEAELDKPENEVLRDWLCAHLGGDCTDPTGQLIKIRSCRGDSYTSCRTRLQDAGFTGTITSHMLGTEDAVMEEQADRVTATSPAPGTQALPDAAITIYVNPDTMPQMTATETAIAEALKTNNPETITDENKKTIARACARYAADGGRTAGDCASLPVFITGADAQGPANNDIAGLAHNPGWFALHRRDAPDNPRWYAGKAEPAPGCQEGVNEPSRPPGEDLHCDEFPFWSTLEAYGGSMNFGITPRIRWTLGTENRRQGRRLQHFYDTSPPSQRNPFRGCNIHKYAATTLPLEVLPGTEFLNVPLPPGNGIDTVGICNRP